MIELNDVSKSYGSLAVVREKSLRAEDGSAFCIIGRNGSGKSTLLKIAALIMSPDCGSVAVDGKTFQPNETDSHERILRKTIGYSFQEPLLIPYLTALENITVSGLDRDRNLDKIRAQELISKLGLSRRKDHLPSKLSTGEKKRIDLARALFRFPRNLVADEPFSSLDPESAELTAQLLKSFIEKGNNFLYSASDPSHSSFAQNRLYL
jgi:putative ABC transport system ATP-binding protein